ncbi:hypothetical protein BKA83DRAFT_4158815 [Pisolithus microcarpus]|nr:hypothetical protein BKA83DRAFT_4158815 [Pisolithus microcarpus]
MTRVRDPRHRCGRTRLHSIVFLCPIFRSPTAAWTRHINAACRVSSSSPVNVSLGPCWTVYSPFTHVLGVLRR